MVEITKGEVKFLHLPETHPIKRFCRRHGITDVGAQDELLDMVMESITAAVTAMVTEHVQFLDEAAAKTSGAVQRVEIEAMTTPPLRELPVLEPLWRRVGCQNCHADEEEPEHDDPQTS